MDLRELIESRLMTQEEVALASAVAQSNISRYVTGRFTPKLANIRKLAHGMGVTDQEVYEACMETKQRKEMALA